MAAENAEALGTLVMVTSALGSALVYMAWTAFWNRKP